MVGDEEERERHREKCQLSYSGSAGSGKTGQAIPNNQTDKLRTEQSTTFSYQHRRTYPWNSSASGMNSQIGQSLPHPTAAIREIRSCTTNPSIRYNRIQDRRILPTSRHSTPGFMASLLIESQRGEEYQTRFGRHKEEDDTDNDRTVATEEWCSVARRGGRQRWRH
ncbi:hypothetical protein U1Q18_038600 [Sarracenia purpurea var. burkii]